MNSGNVNMGAKIIIKQKDFNTTKILALDHSRPSHSSATARMSDNKRPSDGSQKHMNPSAITERE